MTRTRAELFSVLAIAAENNLTLALDQLTSASHLRIKLSFIHKVRLDLSVKTKRV